MVEDEIDPKSYGRMTQLSFEDFLEALVRVAVLKPMPTDEDVANTPACVDGGQLLHALMEGPPAKYRAFLDAHPTQFDALSLQPVERAVDHLCHFMLRTVSGVGASQNAILKPLTRAVVKQCQQPGKSRKGGRRGSSNRSVSPSTTLQTCARASPKHITVSKQCQIPDKYKQYQ